MLSCAFIEESGRKGGSSRQGCQMVCFQTKNPNLGKFWRVLKWKFFYILRPSGLFYGHRKYFIAIWDILWSFGTFFPVLEEKSGNPGLRMQDLSQERRHLT
jgi:hypothetical protein